MEEELERKEDSNVPDFYADRLNLNISPFGVTLVWGLTKAKLVEPKDGVVPEVDDVAIVRTSLLHAKVIGLLLLKNIKKYEDEAGIKVQIPDKILTRLDIKDVNF